MRLQGAKEVEDVLFLRRTQPTERNHPANRRGTRSPWSVRQLRATGRKCDRRFVVLPLRRTIRGPFIERTPLDVFSF